MSMIMSTAVTVLPASYRPIATSDLETRQWRMSLRAAVLVALGFALLTIASLSAIPLERRHVGRHIKLPATREGATPAAGAAAAKPSSRSAFDAMAHLADHVPFAEPAACVGGDVRPCPLRGAVCKGDFKVTTRHDKPLLLTRGCYVGRASFCACAAAPHVSGRHLRAVPQSSVIVRGRCVCKLQAPYPTVIHWSISLTCIPT